MNIAGYKIEKQIGKGGMAMVYLAIQESLGRPVALKVMNPLYADSPEFSQRFLDEGRMLAAVHHTNIITIHDIGISGHFHFISMEYVEGGDLKEKLEHGVTPEQATDIIETVARCLSVAHDAHIVHRDIKPANILFRKDGSLLLTDFGIAKQLSSSRDLTATGSMVGSPYYLSPEQAQGKRVDGRADIYSLGIIYFELLTGEKPFTGDSDIDVAIQHITEAMPDLPDSLSAYRDMIDRMTRKKPDERFPSCKSLLEALKELKSTGKWSGDIKPIPLPETPSPDQSSPSPVFEDAFTATETDNEDGDTQLDKTVPDGEAMTLAGMDTEEADQVEATAVIHETDSDDSNKQTPWLKYSGITALVIFLFIGALFLFGRPFSTDGPEKGAGADDKTSGWISEVLSNTQKDQQIAINRLLQKAELAIKQYRLTTPDEDNAYSYYQEVLRLDPYDQAAQEGLDRIASLYFRLAKNAESDWDYDRALRHIKAGLTVRPENKDLLQLQATLKKEEGELGRSVKNSLKDVKGWFK